LGLFCVSRANNMDDAKKTQIDNLYFLSKCMEVIIDI
jgi:hypothetical protein